MAALRALLYVIARLLGDAQAVRKGRVGQRVANRVIGRAVGKASRKLWR
jgi:hypothetical protein